MVTINADASHEMLDVGTEEIILNGPPSDLRGHIHLGNKSGDTFRIKTLALEYLNRRNNFLGSGAPLHFSCRLRPGEEKIQRVSHRLPPDTRPGTYASELIIGGERRPVKIVVQPHIDVKIYPVRFSFQGSNPDRTHTAAITITNLGNVPFQIPQIKHATVLDMDFLCRAASLAIRDKGAEGYMPMMDQLTKNIQKDMAGWLSISLEECGQVLGPGKSLVAHLTITLPADIDPKKDYSGDIRLWDQGISYVIQSHIDDSQTKDLHGN